MVNLGIISGTITDNNLVKLDEDAVGSDSPYLYGSIYNNGTTSVTVHVQINTIQGLKDSKIPLLVGQNVEFKGLQIHGIQCLNTSPNLNYVFSVVEAEGELTGETRY